MYERARAERAAKEIWGFPGLREEQSRAIAAVCEGKDCFVGLATGQGKSLCYQILPSITREPTMVIVISPLQALVADQIRRYRVTGYTAVNLHTKEALATFLESPDERTRLVFMPPEIAISKEGRALMRNPPVKLGLVAVDEAHCIPEWGKDFRKAFSRIGTLKARIPGVPFMALTATATEAVRDQVKESLNLSDDTVMVLGDLNRKNIAIVRRETKSMQADFQALFDHLRIQKKNTSKHLIYVATKAKCSQVWSLLDDAVPGMGLVDVFHADLSSGKKKAVLEQFRSGEIRVIIATIAFGMGIDIPDVGCVVTYGAATSVSQMYQQMGRAVRNPELTGVFLQYHTKAELQKANEEVRNILNANGCLRKAVLQQLGQELTSQQQQCCSQCGGIQPDSSPLLTTPPPAPKEKRINRPLRNKTGKEDELRKDLKNLHDQELRRQPRFCFFGPKAIMTDATIERLAKQCHRLQGEGDVTAVKGVPSYMADSILAAIDNLFPEKRPAPRRIALRDITNH